MSSEASVRISLQIRAGNLIYRSPGNNGYSANVPAPYSSAPVAGPTPGAVLIQLNHTEPSLAQLKTPGLCYLQNLDSVNTVEVGVLNTLLNAFIPVFELLPTECTVVRLSRMLGQDLQPGTGTGSIAGHVNKLSLKASIAACWCIIDAFNA